MDSAKLSFERDIQNDFNIIHIDTSVDVHQNIDFKSSFQRLCELYSFCVNKSRELKKKLFLKLGLRSRTEVQIHQLN